MKEVDTMQNSTEINYFTTNRSVVCVQGLGFVGAAMAIAVANAVNESGEPHFNVIGVDLPTSEGLDRISKLNEGLFPFPTTDVKLINALKQAKKQGNLIAVSEVSAYKHASVTVVDIHQDVSYIAGKPVLDLDGFRSAIRTLGEQMPQDSLIIVETTVPPGTCEKIVEPELAELLKQRQMDEYSILVAHAYERVMPGENYYDSIVNFWRVFSANNDKAAKACEEFFTKVVNVDKFPLTRLHSTTASEMAKVLENSYRATTIAFMEEWGRFAELVGVDLFEVISAIRKRPTHSNMRQPGFGVGGYCLTKDPLFAGLAAKYIFGLDTISFPFCTQAVQINNAMPIVSLDRVQEMLGGVLKGKKLLLLGITYRQDVGDTRYSPSEIFVREAMVRGAEVVCHDPLVKYWNELNMLIKDNLPDPSQFDAVIFAVAHNIYTSLDFKDWLGNSHPVILDANAVLQREQRQQLRNLGCLVRSIGRGGNL